MSPFRKFLHLAGKIVLFTISLLMVFTALIPFLHPARFWMISILGLVFPGLILLLIVVIIILAIKKSRWIVLPIVLLILNYSQIKVAFALPPSSAFKQNKSNQTLRVLSWNVSRWTEGEHSMLEKQGNSYRQMMLDALPALGADVICFQEFFTCTDPRYFPSNIEPVRNMGYPFFYFKPSSSIVKDQFQTGLAIFSKYPITDSAWLNPFPGEHTEGIQFADINWNGKTIRIFNTHLESPGFDRQAYRSNKLEGIRSTFRKLRNAYQTRKLQADTLKAIMNKCPHPLLLAGDLSDVPNSYAYFKIKKGLQDAFLEKGSGLGKTFHSFIPNLRIDYMLVDKKLEIIQFQHPALHYSDHFPQLLDLRIRN